AGAGVVRASGRAGPLRALGWVLLPPASLGGLQGVGGRSGFLWRFFSGDRSRGLLCPTSPCLSGGGVRFPWARAGAGTSHCTVGLFFCRLLLRASHHVAVGRAVHQSSFLGALKRPSSSNTNL